MKKMDPFGTLTLLRDSMYNGDILGQLDEEGQVTNQEKGHQGCGCAGTVQDGATTDYLEPVEREGERQDMSPV